MDDNSTMRGIMKRSVIYYETVSQYPYPIIPASSEQGLNFIFCLVSDAFD